MPRLLILPVALLLMAASSQQPARGILVEHVRCPADTSQTYTLYLPSAYDTTREWPLLLVFDPGARAARAAEVFREAAERFGWIVAASENSRNGPWEPTLRRRYSVVTRWTSTASTRRGTLAEQQWPGWSRSRPDRSPA